MLRLRGGGKKRKKKTYTKPKKVKHVHKKIKLRVLKFYKASRGRHVRASWRALLGSRGADSVATDVLCRWTSPARSRSSARSAPAPCAAPASSWRPTRCVLAQACRPCRCAARQHT